MTPKYMSTGACNAIAASRISYFFDLHGPSIVLDTACSSTMVALHQAVSALQNGESDMAVVNGSNVILNPDIFVCMSELGFLSPSGRCRTFDASGDGYVRAEGALALLLKPLDKALEDGDPIRAVIRGVHLNQDGRTGGITLPSSEAQRANMEALYEKCGLDPADIQYFEAHVSVSAFICPARDTEWLECLLTASAKGTGTRAGDPLEVSAINAIYGTRHTPEKLVVGSVKSNIGHLEAAAALASIVKTVQAFERGYIPPQMHFVNPYPQIDFTRLKVPTDLMPWPTSRDGVRRAAIYSFGFGGTNGHAVLEYQPHEARGGICSSSDRPYLFRFSAASDASLSELVDRYAHYVTDKRPSLVSLAHTLLARRSTHKRSAVLTASTADELVDGLKTRRYQIHNKAESSARNVAFVFTGQGAQW